MGRRIQARLYDNIKAGSLELPSGAKPLNLFSSSDNYATTNCLEMIYHQFITAISDVRAELVDPTQRAAFDAAYYTQGAVTPIITPHNYDIPQPVFAAAIAAAQSAATGLPGYNPAIWSWDMEPTSTYDEWIQNGGPRVLIVHRVLNIVDPSSFIGSSYFETVEFGR
jgi:hypothetical protein